MGMLHTQVGGTQCAREDSNLTSENLANDIENKEWERSTHIQMD